jgi:hypothetical protein
MSSDDILSGKLYRDTLPRHTHEMKLLREGNHTVDEVRQILQESSF